MPTKKEEADAKAKSEKAAEERRAADQDAAIEKAFVESKLPESDRRAFVERERAERNERAENRDANVDERGNRTDGTSNPKKVLHGPPAVERHTEAQMVVKSSDPIATGDIPTDALMALPVGSIIERVDGGIHLRRRDGNGFHSGYGRTLQDAQDDIRGISPEERKTRDAKDEEERRRRERVNTGDLPKAALNNPDLDPAHKTAEDRAKAEEQTKTTDRSGESTVDPDADPAEPARRAREKATA